MSYPEIVYRGERGEDSARYVPSDGPADLTTVEGTETRYLATQASSNGHLGLYRVDMGPAPYGPGPHFHRGMSESFFILSGTVRLFDGQRWINGSSGDFLHVPPGGVHAFRNTSGEPASMLMLFTPGAPREAYFEGMADIGWSGRRPPDEEMAAFFRRHDSYFVPVEERSVGATPERGE